MKGKTFFGKRSIKISMIVYIVFPVCTCSLKNHEFGNKVIFFNIRVLFQKDLGFIFSTLENPQDQYQTSWSMRSIFFVEQCCPL